MNHAGPISRNPSLPLAPATSDAGEDEQRPRPGAEFEFLELLTDWIQRHHREGGDFSVEAIAAAGNAGRKALRSGYSREEAFDAARTAYFLSLGHVMEGSGSRGTAQAS